MIPCSGCGKPLFYEHLIFGPPHFPLCWLCYNQFLGDDGEDFYQARTWVQSIQVSYSGPCPKCFAPLEIGVADWTVGRTCENCGFHDEIRLTSVV